MVRDEGLQYVESVPRFLLFLKPPTTSSTEVVDADVKQPLRGSTTFILESAEDTSLAGSNVISCKPAPGCTAK